MALIKTNIRNGLACETVDSILSVRYGLKFTEVRASSFIAPPEMLKAFTQDIYAVDSDSGVHSLDEETDLVFANVCEALDALDAL